jgi:hypothetical protein
LRTEACAQTGTTTLLCIHLICVMQDQLKNNSNLHTLVARYVHSIWLALGTVPAGQDEHCDSLYSDTATVIPFIQKKLRRCEVCFTFRYTFFVLWRKWDILCHKFIHVYLDKFSDFHEGSCYFYAVLTKLYHVRDFKQRRLVVNYRRFGTTHRSHLQDSTLWPLKVRLIDCTETSVTNYQSTLCKISEEGRSHLHRGESLRSHSVIRRQFPTANIKRFLYKPLRNF